MTLAEEYRPCRAYGHLCDGDVCDAFCADTLKRNRCYGCEEQIPDDGGDLGGECFCPRCLARWGQCARCGALEFVSELRAVESSVDVATLCERCYAPDEGGE